MTLLEESQVRARLEVTLEDLHREMKQLRADSPEYCTTAGALAQTVIALSLMEISRKLGPISNHYGRMD